MPSQPLQPSGASSASLALAGSASSGANQAVQPPVILELLRSDDATRTAYWHCVREQEKILNSLLNNSSSSEGSEDGAKAK